MKQILTMFIHALLFLFRYQLNLEVRDGANVDTAVVNIFVDVSQLLSCAVFVSIKT